MAKEAGVLGFEPNFAPLPSHCTHAVLAMQPVFCTTVIASTDSRGIGVASLTHGQHLQKKCRSRAKRLCRSYRRCGDKQATVNPRNNLAHCFSCKQNLNNIDLLILLGRNFRSATALLEQWLTRYDSDRKTRTNSPTNRK